MIVATFDDDVASHTWLSPASGDGRRSLSRPVAVRPLPEFDADPEIHAGQDLLRAVGRPKPLVPIASPAIHGHPLPRRSSEVSVSPTSYAIHSSAYMYASLRMVYTEPPRRQSKGLGRSGRAERHRFAGEHPGRLGAARAARQGTQARPQPRADRRGRSQPRLLRRPRGGLDVPDRRRTRGLDDVPVPVRSSEGRAAGTDGGCGVGATSTFVAG